MVNTPSIRFCCCDFGSAVTARSSRGIASAYFPDSNAFTPLRYGSAHRLFCADAEALAISTNTATTRPILMNSLSLQSQSPGSRRLRQPGRLLHASEPNRGREDQLLAEDVRRVNLRFRAEHDADAGRPARLVRSRQQVVLRRLGRVGLH